MPEQTSPDTTSVHQPAQAQAPPVSAPPPVALRRCADYASENLDPALDLVLEDLGGLESFVSAGQRVAVKINMLNRSRPERAVTTQPEFLAAVLERIRGVGAEPVVVESPGGHNTAGLVRRALEETGIGAVCESLGVPFVLLDDDVVDVAVPGRGRYRTVRVGRAIAEADAIVCVPRLKTHAFQRLTCAVKLLFGAVPGLAKAQFHVKVPDRMDFGHMLVDVYAALRPTLAVVDAVVAMEGEGPSSGSPRHVGAILAGADHVAVDVVASRLIGMDPLSVYSTRAAVERGLLARVGAVRTLGDPLDDLCVRDFAHPLADAADRLPRGVVTALKGLTTARPFLARPSACTGCATCSIECPVDAITMRQKKPDFDYDTCIRCYCCQELCPESALGRRNHWLVRPFLRG